MYKNLNAEIARGDFTLEMLVAEMKKRGFNLTVAMLSQKLTGKYKLYLNEAKALREILSEKFGENLSIDYLFDCDIKEAE